MAVSLTLRPVTSLDLTVAQSPLRQTPGSQVIYALTTTVLGSSPTSPTVTAKNLSTGQTVTSQVLSGSASASGDVITLPTVQNLLDGMVYQISIKFTLTGSGTPFERFLEIQCRAS